MYLDNLDILDYMVNWLLKLVRPMRNAPKEYNILGWQTLVICATSSSINFNYSDKQRTSCIDKD